LVLDHHEGYSASEPQPKENGYHHEAHEEHEVRNCNVIISESFVSFVRFVVRISFVKCSIHDE
jgi:hypothetical protein